MAQSFPPGAPRRLRRRCSRDPRRRAALRTAGHDHASGGCHLRWREPNDRGAAREHCHAGHACAAASGRGAAAPRHGEAAVRCVSRCRLSFCCGGLGRGRPMRDRRFGAATAPAQQGAPCDQPRGQCRWWRRQRRWQQPQWACPPAVAAGGEACLVHRRRTAPAERHGCAHGPRPAAFQHPTHECEGEGRGLDRGADDAAMRGQQQRRLITRRRRPRVPHRQLRARVPLQMAPRGVVHGGRRRSAVGRRGGPVVDVPRASLPCRFPSPHQDRALHRT